MAVVKIFQISDQENERFEAIVNLLYPDIERGGKVAAFRYLMRLGERELGITPSKPARPLAEAAPMEDDVREKKGGTQ